jgi:hypothetical protein
MFLLPLVDGEGDLGEPPIASGMNSR